jgi:hypothetical protein
MGKILLESSGGGGVLCCLKPLRDRVRVRFGGHARGQRGCYLE